MRSFIRSRTAPSDSTVVSGICATPDSKRMSGTSPLNFTVSSASSSVSRVWISSLTSVSTSSGYCTQRWYAVSVDKCRSTASPSGASSTVDA